MMISFYYVIFEVEQSLVFESEEIKWNEMETQKGGNARAGPRIFIAQLQRQRWYNKSK